MFSPINRLQGDLRASFLLRDYDEFLNLLHRTGYKKDSVQDEIEDNKLSNFLYFLKLKHFKTSRNLLFERDDGENLFEVILRTPGAGNSSFISVVWTECELWRKQDILVKPNFRGKLPIDYVIESNDEGNLFSFLVFDFDGESETVTKASKKYFLMLKNEQFMERTGKTLFQYFYSIINAECDDIVFDIIEKLLREMKQIVDIETETSINEVLSMKNESYKYRILELLITYWKPHSKKYLQFKSTLSEFSPYYKLLLALKENNEEEFQVLFDDYVNLMQNIYGDDHYEYKVRRDCNSMLEFAIKNGQKRAIEMILELELVDPNTIQFSRQMYDSQIDSQVIHFVMSKLLEKGFYLGPKEGNVPCDWISKATMEDFLDSRVHEDGELCKLSCDNDNEKIFKNIFDLFRNSRL